MIEYLNLNQPSEELDELYGPKDYYWYLSSLQFQKAFLNPLGNIVNRLGGSCLDVGCGEGQLFPHVRCKYVGIDGSSTAIARGRKKYPNADLRVGRIEDPTAVYHSQCDVVVFGDLLTVLVKIESQLDFVNSYRKFYSPKYIVIYDLKRLDVTPLFKSYQLVSTFHNSAKDITLQEVKKHRKIVVFKCK